MGISDGTILKLLEKLSDKLDTVEGKILSKITQSSLDVIQSVNDSAQETQALISNRFSDLDDDMKSKFKKQTQDIIDAQKGVINSDGTVDSKQVNSLATMQKKLFEDLSAEIRRNGRENNEEMKKYMEKQIYESEARVKSTILNLGDLIKVFFLV